MNLQIEAKRVLLHVHNKLIEAKDGEKGPELLYYNNSNAEKLSVRHCFDFVGNEVHVPIL